MTAFLGQRLIQMVPVVLMVTAVSFALIFVLPGDPAMLMIGDRSSRLAGAVPVDPQRSWPGSAGLRAVSGLARAGGAGRPGQVDARP